MDSMFPFPAAVASCIAACRSFVSLTSFRPKDVYVHAAATRPPIRLHPSGGNDVIQICADGGGCASDNSLAKTNRNAGIAFRSKGTCVDSVGQGYSLDQLESRTTDTPTVTNSKGGQDFGGANGSGEVHVHVTVETHKDSVV